VLAYYRKDWSNRINITHPEYECASKLWSKCATQVAGAIVHINASKVGIGGAVQACMNDFTKFEWLKNSM
jgi:hypothetical protein